VSDSLKDVLQLPAYMCCREDEINTFALPSSAGDPICSIPHVKDLANESSPEEEPINKDDRIQPSYFTGATIPSSWFHGNILRVQQNDIPPALPSRKSTVGPTPTASPNNNIPIRRPVLPVQPQESALSVMLATNGITTRSSNPFSDIHHRMMYAFNTDIVDTKEVRIYFPQATGPKGSLHMDFAVPKHTTVKDVIAYALWTYWEKYWEPPLGKAQAELVDPCLSTTGWILRPRMENGEVDEECPRTSTSRAMAKADWLGSCWPGGHDFLL
jgi:hypothetical protein